MIVVLDYGINNLRSVQKSIEYLGFDCRIQSDLEGASKLILPGVGAFGRAMERLEPQADALRGFAAKGHPVLGICLGQQLLFDSSDEFGTHPGLGLIPGKVVYFKRDMGPKVPHIGWSPAHFHPNALLGRGVGADSRFYFVHSLYALCADPGDVAAITSYGIEFASSVQHGNVFGTQFHPEKSGDVGLQVLRNFLEC